MAYSSFQATAKQRSYYRSLTGVDMAWGTSKSKASTLIAKALKGDRPAPKADIVKVYPWRFDALTLRVMTPEMQAVKYAVDRNYQPVNSQFATLAEAEAFARARFPEAQIEVTNNIREHYMD